MIRDGAVTLDVENLTAVGNALEKVSEETGVSVRELSLEVLMLTVQDCVKRMPPSSAAQGKDAVEGDLSRIFDITDTGMIVASWVGVYKGQPGMHVFREQSGRLHAFPESLYGTEQEQLKAHHKRTRLGSTGRPGRNSARMGTQLDASRSYRRKVWEKVGSLKASWLPALDILAPLVRKTPQIPAWIRKAAIKAGTASVNTMSRLGDGFVSATNLLPYARRKAQSFLPTIIERRWRDLNYGMLKRVDEIAKRFNKGAI